MSDRTPDAVRQMVIYAWVGEDEHGSGETGIKQGLVPTGLIPLVSCEHFKLNRDAIREQFQRQANQYGRTIRLCRFVFEAELETIRPE